ncbi:unnamed protein product [Prunus brigantina]
MPLWVPLRLKGVLRPHGLRSPSLLGARRRTCSTTPASTTTSAWRTAPMMILLLPWARSSMPREQSHSGVRPPGRLSSAGREAGTRPIPPRSYLPHASRCGYRRDEAEARWSTVGLPVLDASLLPRAEGGGQYCRH